QANLAVLRLNTKNFDLDFIANLHDFLGAFNLVLRQFGYVQEPLEALLEFHKYPEVRELRHLSRLNVAGMIPPRNVPLPRIVGHLFEAQGHALTLLIDVEHHALDRIPFVDYFAGMADLSDPAHIAHVQQAIDSFFDLDKSAVVGQVSNRSR